MNQQNYALFEEFMLKNMKDSAHDKHHIYRVLYTAMDIAQFEQNVDYDVLICACLLHDIGREEQFANPALCHALIGAEKAHRFLTERGFCAGYAEKVKACIAAHRFRADTPPESTEAKILFDADKIDVTGTVGIARTIFYKGQVSEPLYTLNANGEVADGTEDVEPSFFQEYKYKLENIYANLYTKRGSEIALERQNSAAAFYESMLKEVNASYKSGKPLLENKITP